MTNKSLIIAIVLVIIIGGGLGWYFISNSDSGSNDTNVSNSNINLYITENQKRMEACETWGGTWSSNSLGEEFCSNLSDEENKIGYCDDANGTIGKLTLIDTGDDDDLIDINITIATDVNYTIDSPATGIWNSSSVALTYNFPPTIGTPVTGTTNIKHVNITLTTENSHVEELSDKKIIFNAFSCNLGSYKLERKVFE